MNVIICTDNKYLNDGHLCWIVNFLCCWWPEVQAMDTKFQLNGSSWNACVCSCPGYTNQLAFRKGDGSFAVYPHRQSSTWWGIQTGMNLWLNVCTSASNLHPDYECISRANEWNYTITASPLLSKADSLCCQGVCHGQQSGGSAKERHLWRCQVSDNQSTATWRHV